MKGLFIVLVVAGILYGIYSGAMVAWSYFELSSAMEEAVPRELRQAEDSWARGARADRIRAAVVKAAGQSGIAVDPRSVQVTEQDGSVSVQVRHPYPVVTYAGETKAAIPVTATRSFPLPAGR
jgi:hypothetical protein